MAPVHCLRAGLEFSGKVNGAILAVIVQRVMRPRSQRLRNIHAQQPGDAGTDALGDMQTVLSGALRAETGVACQHDCLGAILHFELGENAGDMVANGLRAQAQMGPICALSRPCAISSISSSSRAVSDSNAGCLASAEGRNARSSAFHRDHAGSLSRSR